MVEGQREAGRCRCLTAERPLKRSTALPSSPPEPSGLISLGKSPSEAHLQSCICPPSSSSLPLTLSVSFPSLEHIVNAKAGGPYGGADGRGRALLQDRQRRGRRW